MTATLGGGGQAAQDQLVTFSRRLLSRFRAETVFNRWGKQDGIPRNGGRGISFRGLTSIYPAGTAGSAAAASAPSALTEGTYPTAIDATWREVIATVSQYGQVMFITDLAEAQSIDPAIPNYVEAFSESMKDGMDLVTRDALMAGTNVQYASSAASRAQVGSGMYLNLAELREAKRTLRRNNAKPVRSEGNKFVVITHTDAEFDLEGDSNLTNIWKDAGDRGMGNQLFDVSFKDLPLGFRLFGTTNARIYASAGLSGADVYATLVIGEEFYGTEKLSAMSAEVIVVRPDQASLSNPLKQLGSVGWKSAHAAKVLDDANGVRIEHVCSTKNAA